MLEVQKWLQYNGQFDLLETQIAISSNFHPTDSRVILNYNQIDSPKLHPIVQECRGLVLDRNNYKLIGRGFKRFLNWGEGPQYYMDRFEWKSSIGTVKEDGSLLLAYVWNGQLHINTRNSFGTGEPNNSGLTWRELFLSTLKDPTKLELVEGRSYVFELCSPQNQVVRFYKEPTCYLLTVFDGEVEWGHDTTVNYTIQHGLNTPESILFNDPFEVTQEIAKRARSDKTFEGFVLRDIFGHRFKFKSTDYLTLHRFLNNGAVGNERLLSLILDGESDEILTYFPNLLERLENLKIELDRTVKRLDNIWYCHWDVGSRKRFAEIVKKEPLSFVLFNLYGQEYNPDAVLNQVKLHKEKVGKLLE